jgi:hypothetical protein
MFSNFENSSREKSFCIQNYYRFTNIQQLKDIVTSQPNRNGYVFLSTDVEDVCSLEILLFAVAFRRVDLRSFKPNIFNINAAKGHKERSSSLSNYFFIMNRINANGGKKKLPIVIHWKYKAIYSQLPL